MLLPEAISAESISRKTVEELRAVGISGQKASYLLDLSAHVLDERLAMRTIGRKSDAEVIKQLIAVKGIGEWTAHMFLIFSLGRPDVFPHGDLGVRSALKILYDLENLPDKTTSLRLAEPWRPYASVASWYCWRLHDLPALES
jgi:DNA-3-methyladenine glycosylase II